MTQSSNKKIAVKVFRRRRCDSSQRGRRVVPPGFGATRNRRGKAALLGRSSPPRSAALLTVGLGRRPGRSRGAALERQGWPPASREACEARGAQKRRGAPRREALFKLPRRCQHRKLLCCIVVTGILFQERAWSFSIFFSWFDIRHHWPVTLTLFCL